MLKLTIFLKDGRIVSCTYPYMEAIAREMVAQKYDQYSHSTLTEVA